MDVAIVDSGRANVASVAFAVERAGGTARSTVDPREISSADRVILPGVGSAAAVMRRLGEAGLDKVLLTLSQPVLGICLGMQILHEFSDEGDTRCLGLLPGRIAAIPAGDGLRLPHMGWSPLSIMDADDPLLSGVEDGDYVYFVHSYFAATSPTAIATARHGVEFAAVERRQNFWACQFHPERSGPVGARIVQNFLALEC